MTAGLRKVVMGLLPVPDLTPLTFTKFLLILFKPKAALACLVTKPHMVIHTKHRFDLDMTWPESSDLT
jgi:hypothetical protein